MCGDGCHPKFLLEGLCVTGGQQQAQNVAAVHENAGGEGARRPWAGGEGGPWAAAPPPTSI